MAALGRSGELLSLLSLLSHAFSLPRFGSLDSSSVVLDGKLESTVRGLISSTISPSGSYGDLILNMNARGGSGGNQVTTSNHAMWDTASVWKKAGTLRVNSSLLYLEGNEINWDAVSALDYQDNGYKFSVVNSNPTSIENLYCHGNGRYGGNWMQWFVSLPSSLLRHYIHFISL